MNRQTIIEHLVSLGYTVAKHTGWSYRQLSCCLYWQGTARKALKSELGHWLAFGCERPDVVTTLIPEAMGVDVTETMRRIGIILEWPPLETVYKIAFVGSPASLQLKPDPKQQTLFPI